MRGIDLVVRQCDTGLQAAGLLYGRDGVRGTGIIRPQTARARYDPVTNRLPSLLH